VDHLLNTTNMAAAQRVLLSGSSAGGLGTFVNADYVADKLAPYGVSVFANPQGGFFFPAVTAYPQFTAGFLGPPYAFQNDTIFDETFNAYPNAACIAAHDPSYWWVWVPARIRTALSSLPHVLLWWPLRRWSAAWPAPHSQLRLLCPDVAWLLLLILPGCCC